MPVNHAHLATALPSLNLFTMAKPNEIAETRPVLKPPEPPT